MEYAIIKAEWDYNGHDAVHLTVAEKQGGGVVREFSYTASENDSAPLNKLLWAMVRENPSVVQENTLKRIINGELPVPDGHTLIGDALFNDADETRRLRMEIRYRQDVLYSGHVLRMAEKDPIFAENRLRQLDILDTIEDLPGFPYGINIDRLMEEDDG